MRWVRASVIGNMAQSRSAIAGRREAKQVALLLTVRVVPLCVSSSADLQLIAHKQRPALRRTSLREAGAR